MAWSPKWLVAKKIAVIRRKAPVAIRFIRRSARTLSSVISGIIKESASPTTVGKQGTSCRLHHQARRHALTAMECVRLQRRGEEKKEAGK
ncbi:MAG: hypothetical protein DYG96_11395 [Chlorobi bacterium CHB2]|nr:hypothetical protein [Chlorobi bacterium CHB2]